MASWRLNLANDRLHWSDAVETLLGAGQRPRTRADFLTLVHPHDRPQLEAAWEGALRGKPFALDYRLSVNDQFIWMHEIVRVESSASEFPTHAMGTLQDITESRKAADAHAILEAQLRQSQKLEAIGQLAGGVAHDFNNILTAILGNTEICIAALSRQGANQSPIIDAMENVRKSAERAAALTRQLLAFSRNQVIQPQSLDLRRVVAGLHELLSRLIKENITLDVVAAPELASVHADANQLEQVVLNLVVNAADAMPGGGRLTIETRNVELDADYVAMHTDALVGPHVLLRVSDSGAGIPADVRDRIFDPFFTTKPLGKGTGLGLATAHGIVKQAGGHIAVYSEIDKGTTFKVFLPAQAGVATDDPRTAKPPAERGAATILLAEDDHLLRKLVTRQLTTAGYTVLAAPSGAEALEIARAHDAPFDLLITDVIMPEMNGRELSEQMTAHQPGLPVLFVSGYTANVISDQGVLDAGVEFLEKPFTREALLARVHEVLNRNACAAPR